MKQFFHFFILASIMWSSNSSAASDSVAVFFTSAKTSVLINERGSNSRLHDFMNALNWGNKNQWESEDKQARFVCGRNDEAASCTFTVFPSPAIRFGNRQVLAALAFDTPVQSQYEMFFESSNGDSFFLKIKDQTLFIEAKKKVN